VHFPDNARPSLATFCVSTTYDPPSKRSTGKTKNWKEKKEKKKKSLSGKGREWRGKWKGKEKSGRIEGG